MSKFLSNYNVLDYFILTILIYYLDALTDFFVRVKNLNNSLKCGTYYFLIKKQFLKAMRKMQYIY